MDAIVVDALEKTYGKDVRALDGMTFSVPVSRPSLDDVYLHHTGRDFRADDEAGAR